MSATNSHTCHHGHTQPNLPAGSGGTGGVLKNRVGRFIYLGAEASLALHLDPPVDHRSWQLLLLVEQFVLTQSAVAMLSSAQVGLHIHHKRSAGLHSHNVKAFPHQIMPGYEGKLLALGAGDRFATEGNGKTEEQQQGSHLQLEAERERENE